MLKNPDLFRKTVAAAAMLVWPVLLGLAFVTSPPGTEHAPAVFRASPVQVQASALLFQWATACLVPVILGLAHLLRGRAPRTGNIGAAVGLTGAVTAACLFMTDFYDLALGLSLPDAQAARVTEVAGALGGFVYGILLPGFLTHVGVTHGLLAQPEPGRDLAVRQVGGDQAQDLPLTRGELGEAGPGRPAEVGEVTHQPPGEGGAEDRLALGHGPDRPDELGPPRALEHVSPRARAHRREDRVVVVRHAEHEDPHVRMVPGDALGRDQRAHERGRQRLDERGDGGERGHREGVGQRRAPADLVAGAGQEGAHRRHHGGDRGERPQGGPPSGRRGPSGREERRHGGDRQVRGDPQRTMSQDVRASRRGRSPVTPARTPRDLSPP